MSTQSLVLKKCASGSLSGFSANSGLKCDQFNCSAAHFCAIGSGCTTGCMRGAGGSTGCTGSMESTTGGGFGVGDNSSPPSAILTNLGQFVKNLVIISL